MLVLSAATVAPVMSYFHAIIIGLLQGVTELFPISSLGHSVLVPALLGWKDVGSQSAGESPYLAFVVGLHVATAIALLVFFRQDWIRIIKGFFSSVAQRRVETPAERMAWLLILGTVPVGIVGLVFEHSLRTIFAKPLAAAIFLTINGVILLAGEALRRRDAARTPAAQNRGTEAGGPAVAVSASPDGPSRDLDSLAYPEGVGIASAQIGSLFAGISRSGITMVAGLARGLDHEDAARFSFLLATPVILAAGVYKAGDLLGPLGDHIRGQVVVGSICAGLAAFLAVRFLVRWFETRTLTPFAIYCLIAGALCTVRFGFF